MWLYREKRDLEYKKEGTVQVFYYEVGYLEPVEVYPNVFRDQFIPVENYSERGLARTAVNYLNGGNDSVQVSGVVYNQA